PPDRPHAPAGGDRLAQRLLESGRLARYGRRVDVELLERPVRVRPGAVRVVRPGRVREAAVEAQPAVVAEVDPVPGDVRVRRRGAALLVRIEARPAVARERAPELGVVVRDAVRVAGPARAQVVAGVVPDDGEMSVRRIERDLGHELAVRPRVVVY